MTPEQLLEIKSMFIDISGATSSAFEAISFGLRIGQDVESDLRREAVRIGNIAAYIHSRLEVNRATP